MPPDAALAKSLRCAWSRSISEIARSSSGAKAASAGYSLGHQRKEPSNGQGIRGRSFGFRTVAAFNLVLHRPRPSGLDIGSGFGKDNVGHSTQSPAISNSD